MILDEGSEYDFNDSSYFGDGRIDTSYEMELNNGN